MLFMVQLRIMKSMLTLRIDKDLHDFLKHYAKASHTTVTGLITQYAFYLKKRSRKHGFDKLNPTDNHLSLSNLPNNQTKAKV